MYIDSPIWTLKKRCPCCYQEGYLELYTCDECKKIVAICDEVCTVFINPLDINLDKISDKENDVCYYCNSMGKMRRSKDYELISLGLTTSDYE